MRFNKRSALLTVTNQPTKSAQRPQRAIAATPPARKSLTPVCRLQLRPKPAQSSGQNLKHRSMKLRVTRNQDVVILSARYKARLAIGGTHRSQAHHEDLTPSAVGHLCLLLAINLSDESLISLSHQWTQQRAPRRHVPANDLRALLSKARGLSSTRPRRPRTQMSSSNATTRRMKCTGEN